MALPSVGIFWGCRSQDGSLVLLADKTPIDQAEQYGECRTYPTGHAEFWEGLARLGESGLKRRGYPTDPVLHEYEAVPRGRVVYLPAEERFIIYADRRLHGTAFIGQIIAAFGIPSERYDVKADPHYRPARDTFQQPL